MSCNGRVELGRVSWYSSKFAFVCGPTHMLHVPARLHQCSPIWDSEFWRGRSGQGRQEHEEQGQQRRQKQQRKACKKKIERKKKRENDNDNEIFFMRQNEKASASRWNLHSKAAQPSDSSKASPNCCSACLAAILIESCHRSLGRAKMHKSQI